MENSPKINGKRPNFFIIGAPKCGTTSLAMWLSEHPNVYMSPIKEPSFFCSDVARGSIDSFEEYIRLFEGASDRHICLGEASTSYLFSKVAVQEIERVFPGSRYIVMLRNPVDMAYSLHGQRLRDFENIRDFEKAWRLSELRQDGSNVPWRCPNPVLLDYPAWCRLGDQLKRLFDTVDRRRVLVLLLDDIRMHPGREYRRVLGFLGVGDDGREDFPVFNPARELKWKSLHKFIVWGRHNISIAKDIVGIKSIGLGWLGRAYDNWNERCNLRMMNRPSMPTALRNELVNYFKDDIKDLESLLGRDLSGWLR